MFCLDKEVYLFLVSDMIANGCIVLPSIKLASFFFMYLAKVRSELIL